MTHTELRDALKALGMTQRSLAATLGLDKVTVNRWAQGSLPVPQYAVAYLDLASGYFALEAKAMDVMDKIIQIHEGSEP